MVVPKKKPRLSAEKEEATTSALRSAAEVMSSVCQRMAQPKQQQQQPNNATRAFCDMLYHQLMSFDDLEKEEIQLEVQQVVMRHRRRTYTYNCATDPSPSAATSFSSLLASAQPSYYDM